MKYILIAVLFLITGSKGMAQIDTTHFTVVKSSSIWKSARTVVYWKTGSDTIEITEPLQIHYIKIGNDVYQLIPHNTTIERAIAKPESLIGDSIYLWPGNFRFNNNSTVPVTQ